MSEHQNGLSRILNSGRAGIQSDAINIDIDKLVPFSDVNGIVNPSKVDESDPEYIALKENIAKRGLDHPITVRPLSSDKTTFQILCGHHRVAACKALGYPTIKAFVRRDLSDDDAAELVALDNFNRKKNYKPSEKAAFFKMALDARKRRTGRKVEGIESEGSSLDELASLVGEGRGSIARFIRLNYLIPELLNLVDTKNIKIVPAVELSYIPGKQQAIVFNILTEDPDIKITAPLAKELRIKSERSELTESKVRTTLGASSQTKKNPFNRKVKNLIPDYMKDDPEEITEYLVKAIMFYQEHNKEEE